MNNPEINALEVEASQTREIAKALIGDLRSANALLLVKEVGELKKLAASLGARVGDLESRERRRDERIDKSSEAFKRMDGRLSKVEFNQQPAKATA